ncbi:MAG: sugar phosphate isomerase/epimerase [Planctomycetes bacterium]|nr:sugar phosphate isomerase/epimerase [Planctomycetota bacterium]
MNHPSSSDPSPQLARRELLGYSAAFGAGVLANHLGASKAHAQDAKPRSARRGALKRYDMKKSINLWAFPYPQQWSLQECFELAKDAGFDGVEINFDLEGEFSAESSDAQVKDIGRMAEKAGIAISGVCSFLFWPYAFSNNDPQKRRKGIELAMRMAEAARLLNTENVLVVPGAVYIPWLEDAEPVPNDVCDRRAREAVRQLIPAAEKNGVYLNMENIFANGYLFSPQEMVAFVDSFQSDRVQVHFDTGNIMEYQFPEHWIPILGKRIKNIHFKEWDKRTHEFNLHTFRTLLDGTTNWPAVLEALDQIGYRGYLTFEYFHPHQHYPEALLYQTSDALDYMLGRKAELRLDALH